MGLSYPFKYVAIGSVVLFECGVLDLTVEVGAELGNVRVKGGEPVESLKPLGLVGILISVSYNVYIGRSAGVDVEMVFLVEMFGEMVL